MSSVAPGRQGIVARARASLATRRVSVVVRSVGYLLIFGGFLLALQGSLIVGLWLVLLGWLLMRAARSNYNAGRVTSLLDGLVARDAMDPDPPGVPPTLTLETLVEEDDRQTGGSGIYPVRLGPEILGVVDVLDADRVPRGAWAATRVEQVMHTVESLEGIPPEEPLVDVVARFERTRREGFVVLDPATPDRIAGLVTRERVHQLLRSRAARIERDRARARGATGR